MATAPDEGRADALQHRCAQLEEENARLSSKLLRARRLIARVEKEKSFVLGRLLQYEGWQASDSGTDTNSSGEEEEEDHDEGIEMSDDGSDSEQSSESEPPAKKAKRGLKRDRLPSRPKGRRLCWRERWRTVRCRCEEETVQKQGTCRLQILLASCPA